ncbi:leucine--tRNA ligase [Candidatus Peregrinibacteria bacterium CG10_big_fil_rev_8_21_14_0_10_49_16]|nr:MAG: leucine--tRNA ligase [Candidatus Peregrinibacteria bacterium CG22_combo_CG10-13_8_21_14_all_49_11]PIR52290.1 MAG: leucine--tRNA ligase [Candidatus Peregrinibacteria bacterium CG10_big_fil_rev_8_21_14_0_10_49_16]
MCTCWQIITFGTGLRYDGVVTFYDPKSIEQKWQKKWQEAGIYRVDLDKAKDPYYCLVMFPYPSGARLHVGHWFQYGPTDSFARFRKLQGKDVFFPMGFDAFGLPAENYAMKTGTPPAESTAQNVRNMMEQFARMGCMCDWQKSLNTSAPEYYRWTQWLFLQMFRHDLAYKKQALVNFCPKCQTVLANEQCQDGACERCGTEVEQKPLKQWFWKITHYAQRLLDGLDDLDWPEQTKLMQRHWIGRSEGAIIQFKISCHPESIEAQCDTTIEVFTTRPDTLFGATYLVLAPEHPLLDDITPKEYQGAVHAYKEEVRKKSEMERTELNKTKTGVPTGAYAINPATKEKIPIWIADYVIMNYGTGAVMAVPAHDERDFEFAKTYELPMQKVVQPVGAPLSAEQAGLPVRQGGNGGACTEEGTAINSDFLNGLSTPEAKKRIVAWLEDEEIGRQQINYRLRDWLVSRQRYWGAPIPVVYDPEGNPHPIPDEHLPWLLPTDVEFKPTGESPLTDSKEFIERTEKIFGEGWRPEFDTMDTFVCSSFYYLRFLMENDGKNFVDKKREKKWMPVDMYIGGPEHSCMHLLYARFVMMALKDAGVVSHEEPFQKLFHQGLITKDGAKMSKSKGNVVDPDPLVETYGSDAFRMYMMFMGPYSDGGDFSDTGIKGVERFLQRVWKLVEAHQQVRGAKDSKEVQIKLHATVKKVTEDLEVLHFNTAISALMELLNVLEKQEGVTADTLKICTILLAPLAPHFAEELWEKLGEEPFVFQQKWPTFHPKFLVADQFTIVVQVNGRVRATVEVDAGASKEDILTQAKNHPHVQKWLNGTQSKKEIYVPEKLVNFVV